MPSKVPSEKNDEQRLHPSKSFFYPPQSLNRQSDLGDHQCCLIVKHSSAPVRPSTKLWSDSNLDIDASYFQEYCPYMDEYHGRIPVKHATAPCLHWLLGRRDDQMHSCTIHSSIRHMISSSSDRNQWTCLSSDSPKCFEGPEEDHHHCPLLGSSSDHPTSQHH